MNVGAKFELAVSDADREAFIDQVTENPEQTLNGICGKIDLNRSECTVPIDRENIFEAIKYQHRDVEELNFMIHESLRNGLMYILHSRLEARPECHFPLAEIMRHMGQWEASLRHYQDAMLVCTNNKTNATSKSTLQQRRQCLSIASGIAQLFAHRGWHHISEGILMSCLSADYKFFIEPNEERVRLLYLMSRVVDAEELHWFLKDAIETAKTIVSPDNDYLLSLLEMSAIHNFKTKFDCEGSVQILKHCLAVKETKYGKRHPDALLVLRDIALTYFTKRQYGQCGGLLKECIHLLEIVLGEFHKETIKTKFNLALVYVKLEKSKEAITLLEYCENISKTKLNDYLIHEISECLVDVKSQQQQHNKTKPLFCTPPSTLKVSDGYDKEMIYRLMDVFVGIDDENHNEGQGGSSSITLDSATISKVFTREEFAGKVHAHPRRNPQNVPFADSWNQWWINLIKQREKKEMVKEDLLLHPTVTDDDC
jgi:tetratricopeptide (TPR) repeat protein